MTGNKILSIDLETFSDNDIREGVYKYSDSPNFEILLCAYAYDDEPVQVIDLAQGEALPQDFIDALQDPRIEKHAYNASFERVCLSIHLRRLGILPPGAWLKPWDWWCTAVHASMFGLPRSLKDVAKVLALEEQKDTAGTMLINYFAKPCKQTKVNGGRTRNYWYHDEKKWNMFKSYNAQDVVTERAISKFLDANYDRNLDVEKQNYAVNEIVNDNGILIDRSLCQSIVDYNDVYLAKQLARSKEITGLENPNSLTQLKPWLIENGLPDTPVTKDTLPDLIATATSPDVREVLQIRQQLSATSVSKYQRMLSACCSDGRVHGVLQFYGANRTGRYAGRLIQTQNFPKNHIDLKELDAVRTMVRNGDWDEVEALYDDLQDLFKQLLRTALIAPEGYVLSVADYSAIEARVSAWMAHEEWAEIEFHGKGKIYESTAAQMFGVPIETIAKGRENYDLRQRGKVASLACGYGGSSGAMAAMDVGHKINPEDYPELVRKWRRANPNIVRYWSTVENACMRAMDSKETIAVENLRFKYRKGNLFIRLPSGRWLTYYQARVEDGQITYMGTDAKGWTRLRTFGGKLVENIVQATARDCLADSVREMVMAGMKPIFHVHDEIICEIPAGDNDWAKIHTEIMGEQRDWEKQFGRGKYDLYHPAPGFTTKYYLKD